MSSPSFRSHGPARLDPADRAQLDTHPVSLGRIAALFKPHRRRLLLVVGLIALSSALGLATPFLTRHVIDVALPDRDLRLLVTLVAGMLAVTVLSAALGVVQTWISTAVGQDVMHRLRTDVFTHLQRQPMSFFTRTRGGEVQSRLTHDIGSMQQVVTGTATAVTANVTTAIGTIIAMVALSWQLSLFSLVVLPPAIWLTRRVARMRREFTARRQRALADLQGQVEESLSVSGALLAKTLGAGPELRRRFAESSAELVDLEMRSELAGRWRMATTSIIFSAIPALIYLAAGLPGSGDVSIGTLVAFVSLQSGLFRPIMGVLNTGVQVTASLALFSRIFEYLDLPVDIDDPAEPVTLPAAAGPGAVTFEAVTFRYPDADADAVSGLDLHVPAGTRLALVGESGAGKTTIAGLVARLHDPTEGRVLLDGVDLRDLSLTDLARQVGVVSQETYLLHTTVRENLRYARPEASDAEIEAAARAAQVHDVITALPAGYDTVVGARGHRFSGGEKQRLAIARTLLRDPRVLVLDEATSALDTRTEHAVQEALDVLSHGRTTITIAHRLSTVRDADLIAVVDGGRLVEVGDHETLLAQGGHYAALVAAAERGPALVAG
ncbi:ABC transporter ATP-binding protein [Georgenia sp. 311]|uniref:ABC transporter ATP-binding protein n=1 Tax=Georgenia sp. 311 TaxID=2585134 RepID=UPI001112C31F|nr:ABC transporter ATP-binding protein [Georgenia sp. 311]TNC16553.1 ABC transporter ATP-binding protein [Georgenia sp. 311]